MARRRRPFGKWDLVPVLAGLFVLGALAWFQREATSTERRAERLLGQLRDPKSFPEGTLDWVDEMRRMHKQRDERRSAIIRELVELGPGAAGPVVAALRDPAEKPSVRAAAARVVVETGPHGEVVPALTEALRAQNALVRRCAAESLGRIGAAARGAVPDLEAACEDKDADVAKTARHALGRICP
jgi:HEAT repeat protein